MSENLCVSQNSCCGLCCHDTTIVVSAGEFDPNFMVGAQIVDPRTLASKRDEALAQGVLGLAGVYATQMGSDTFIVQLVGACPRLNPDTFNCGALKKPLACIRFPFDGNQCRSLRTDSSNGNNTIYNTP